jgi:hypothetical protein
MIIILSIPLGILCLILAGMCLRVGKRPHACVCALTGLFFLSLAVVMSYATNVLVQEIARTS